MITLRTNEEGGEEKNQEEEGRTSAEVSLTSGGISLEGEKGGYVTEDQVPDVLRQLMLMLLLPRLYCHS